MLETLTSLIINQIWSNPHQMIRLGIIWIENRVGECGRILGLGRGRCMTYLFFNKSIAVNAL